MQNPAKLLDDVALANELADTEQEIQMLREGLGEHTASQALLDTMKRLDELRGEQDNRHPFRCEESEI